MTCNLLQRSALPILGMMTWTGCIAKPVVESLPEQTFVTVSTGRDHTCALTDTGTVFCWSRADPRPVEVSNGVVFRTVSTFWDHSCGIAITGAAWCWGLNTVGQLGVADSLLTVCVVGGGVASSACSPVPLPVSGNLAFESLSVGAAHTCGLATDGTAWCWGAHGSGQLGVAQDTDCGSRFIPEGFTCSVVPVEVAGGHRFRTISAGRAHTCAVDDNGAAYCWGAGDSGRLGDGGKESRSVPVPVAGGLTFRSVSAGGSHTCGVTIDDVSYCWGSNSDMQAGTIETELACGNQVFRCFTTPHPVGASVSFHSITASDAVQQGAGGPAIGGHSCGLTADGTAWCWGLNTEGQLVNYGDLRSPNPIRISEEFHFVEINAGLSNTCGVTTEGNVLCWAFGGPATRFFTFPRG